MQQVTQLTNKPNAVLIILIAALVWLPVTAWHYSRVESCRDKFCSTGTAWERTAPLCVVDPTCVSPFFNAKDASQRYWTGFEVNDLRFNRSPVPVGQSPALVNLILFMLLSDGAMIIAQKRQRLAVRKTLAISIRTWCILSIALWSAVLLSPGFSWGIALEALAVLSLTFGSLAAINHFVAAGDTNSGT